MKVTRVNGAPWWEDLPSTRSAWRALGKAMTEAEEIAARAHLEDLFAAYEAKWG